MISLINLFVQNGLNKGLRGDLLVQLRCISKSYNVNKSDYLMTTTRLLSTVYSKSGTSTVPKDKNQEFMSLFPDFVRDVKKKAGKFDSFGTEKHLERVLQYNLPDGKKNRGVTALMAYELMAPKSSLTEANVKLSIYLGWCIELFQAYMIIIDDIMDESITRRRKACWYKVEDIGMSSINDAVMLEAGIYQILKDHFSHLECYVKLIELFHEITFIMCVGQYLDTKKKYEDVLSFTMDQFNAIATKKTFYYSFYFPIRGTMYLTGNTDEEGFRQANIILREIAYFIQVQNDILDCFGDPEVQDKIGTDIQNNKCSWLAVKCLERANEAQKAIMKENYGKNDEECIGRVKQLYEELSLHAVYQNYEEDTCNIFKKKIQQVSRVFPIELYMRYLTKLQKREV